MSNSNQQICNKKSRATLDMFALLLPHQTNTLSGVFFWWTSQNVFTTRESLPRPLYKKTPFRVCSFGGLQRTCLQHENPSPSTVQKNTLSGVFFWWTGMDSNHRRRCRQIYSLIPLATREPVLELVIGVEPTTC